jgi:hypothetical protein
MPVNITINVADVTVILPDSRADLIVGIESIQMIPQSAGFQAIAANVAITRESRTFLNPTEARVNITMPGPEIGFWIALAEVNIFPDDVAALLPYGVQTLDFLFKERGVDLISPPLAMKGMIDCAFTHLVDEIRTVASLEVRPIELGLGVGSRSLSLDGHVGSVYGEDFVTIDKPLKASVTVAPTGLSAAVNLPKVAVFVPVPIMQWGMKFASMRGSSQRALDELELKADIGEFSMVLLDEGRSALLTVALGETSCAVSVFGKSIDLDFSMQSLFVDSIFVANCHVLALADVKGSLAENFCVFRLPPISVNISMGFITQMMAFAALLAPSESGEGKADRKSKPIEIPPIDVDFAHESLRIGLLKPNRPHSLLCEIPGIKFVRNAGQ